MGILLKTTHFLQKRLDIHANKGWTLELLNAFPFWIGAAITGVIAVVYAQLFRFAEEGTAALFRTNKWLLFISTPLCFVVAWWLVKKFSPYSRGSGIPQVSAAVDLANPKQYYKVEKLLSVRVVVVKILSSLVMVFGGGGVGREGPTYKLPVRF